MTNIPEDIEKTARQLFNMSWRRAHSSEEQDACINAIASALRAERERCAAEIAALKAKLSDVYVSEAQAREGVNIWRARAMEAEALKADNERLRDVTTAYRAATAWVAADAWDGCRDCMDQLKAASAYDYQREPMTPDELAAALAVIRPFKPHNRARAALEGK